ncbi:MAG: hypothetical protein ACRD8W_03680, partial [Nitrososphaeraceae archaeon]
MNSLEQNRLCQCKSSSNSGNSQLKIMSISVISLIAVIAVCIIYAAVISAILPQKAYAQSDSWFVGKGLEPNTYYTYEIREFDTNQGRPFLMTIYFKEFDSNNNVW